MGIVDFRNCDLKDLLAFATLIRQVRLAAGKPAAISQGQSAFERGRADNYYRRRPRPHKWLDNCGREPVYDLSDEEIEDYWMGWEENERNGDWKDYE